MTKPSGRVLNPSQIANCSIVPVTVKDVEVFIKRHYLKKRPAIVLCCLAMTYGKWLVGCIVYSAPPRESSKRYGGTTWELARLYLIDEMPTNSESWFIAKSIKWVKANHKEVDYLVSYADPSAGHTGVIYKASNWISDGHTDEERKSPRCDYYDGRTNKKYGRRGNMPNDAIVQRRPRIPKARFVYPLKRNFIWKRNPPK